MRKPEEDRNFRDRMAQDAANDAHCPFNDEWSDPREDECPDCGFDIPSGACQCRPWVEESPFD